MRKDTINIHKAIARKEHPIPSPKVFKTKKDYNRREAKKINYD